MTIKATLEAQLQQLGSRKVTPKEFPQSARWGAKYTAYTSLSGAGHLFIFLGSAGACRTGSSPAFSRDAPFLKDKLLARAAAQEAKAKPRAKPLLRFGTIADLDLP